MTDKTLLFLNESQDAYYFGCWLQPGHYLWLPGMRRSESNRALSPILDSRKWQCGNREGVAKVSHVYGNTVLSFPDYSVDKRSGSHSTFVLRGEYNFEESLRLAKENFPRVFERFNYEIIEGR